MGLDLALLEKFLLEFISGLYYKSNVTERFEIFPKLRYNCLVALSKNISLSPSFKLPKMVEFCGLIEPIYVVNVSLNGPTQLLNVTFKDMDIDDCQVLKY